MINVGFQTYDLPLKKFQVTVRIDNDGASRIILKIERHNNMPQPMQDHNVSFSRRLDASTALFSFPVIKKGGEGDHITIKSIAIKIVCI